MSHGQQPTLTTERLLLRPATPADLDAWTERIFADSEVTRYIPSSIAEPRARAAHTLPANASIRSARGYGEWLVTDRRDGELLGHCGLLDVAETGEVEIDYALARPFWGRGYASEAARACLRFGFEQAGLERVIGLAVPENNASRRVLERIGFVYQRDATYFGHLLALHWLTAERFRAVNPAPPEGEPAPS